MRQLQAVLNAAARLIVCKRKYDSISNSIRDVLHWLPIRQCVDYKLSLLVFNCFQNRAPEYLTSICQLVSTIPGRQCLRLAVDGDLIIPTTRTVHYGPRSFTVAGPSVWNSLPTSLRNLSLTPTMFRHRLKTELFHRAYTFS
jgi:hypothetical protein